MNNAEEQLRTIHTAGGKSFHEIQTRRSRIIAFTLSSATVISLAFLIFALSQRDRADSLVEELIKVKQELEECRKGS